MGDASTFPRSQAAIAGIGCTEFSKDSGMSTFGLAARAVKAAVADAGLELRDRPSLTPILVARGQVKQEVLDGDNALGIEGLGAFGPDPGHRRDGRF